MFDSAILTRLLGEQALRAPSTPSRELKVLAKRNGVNPKTIAKRRSRELVADLPTGPKKTRSPVLSVEEEAVIVALRKDSLLPLDGCLYALRPLIPHLTRWSLHRCAKRHGISRLPQVGGEASPKRKFQVCRPAGFHADIAAIQVAEGKAPSHRRDRPDVKVRLRRTAREGDAPTAADFLRRLIEAISYQVHTVLTDNVTQFTDPWPAKPASQPKSRRGSASRRLFRARLRICPRLQRCRSSADQAQASLDERSAQTDEPHHQGCDANTRFYEAHNELRVHLLDFVDALGRPSH